MPAFALCSPLSLSSRSPASLTRLQPRRPVHIVCPPSRIVPTARRSARGSGPAPEDDAFVTCPSCGSDEPVAAATLIRNGTAMVRCGQCGNRWTARASEAMTDSGASLLEQLEEARLASKSVPGATSSNVNQQSIDARNVGVKLYVAGLGAKVDSAALRRVMENYGEVREANVVFDRATGRSRGFGFVTVVGRSAASAAIDDLSGSTALGRRISVREAIQ